MVRGKWAKRKGNLLYGWDELKLRKVKGTDFLFPSLAHQFLSSQFGRKWREKKGFYMWDQSMSYFLSLFLIVNQMLGKITSLLSLPYSLPHPQSLIPSPTPSFLFPGNYTLPPKLYPFYTYPLNYENAYFTFLNYYMHNTCLPKLW